MKWLEIQQKLETLGMTVFSSQDLRRATGLSLQACKFFLIRYAKRGLVLQLKKGRGLYALSHKPPHPFALANKLYTPSYISFESALSHHGLIPESVYAVTSATSGTSRTFESMGRPFTYQRIKKEAFTGYQPIQVQNETVLMAETEKALADTLYFCYLGKKELNSRIRWPRVQRSKLVHHVKQFNRKGLTRWAQELFKNARS